MYRVYTEQYKMYHTNNIRNSRRKMWYSSMSDLLNSMGYGNLLFDFDIDYNYKSVLNSKS